MIALLPNVAGVNAVAPRKSAVVRVAILPIVAGVAVVRTGVATAFAAGQVKLAVMVSVAILVTVVPKMIAELKSRLGS